MHISNTSFSSSSVLAKIAFEVSSSIFVSLDTWLLKLTFKFKIFSASVIDNLRLVVFLAKKYENTGVDLEDLVSIGTIGLIKGINTFSKSKNIKLATYASRCIDNEILMHLRKIKKIKTEVSFDSSLSYDSEGNELHLEDIIGTGEDVTYKEYEKMTDIGILKDRLEELNARDKQIMIMRYGLYNTKEYTQKEVASILGISQSYISRIEKKVIKRLKLHLE